MTYFLKVCDVYITTDPWRNNNVNIATSFWRNNYVVVALSSSHITFFQKWDHTKTFDACNWILIFQQNLLKNYPWQINWPPWLLTVSSQWAHRELTVTKMITASRAWAVTWAVIELWPRRDWAVTYPWLSCDLAVTELWPLLAVTEPWSLGLGAVTTVVTVSSRWAHGEHLFSHGYTYVGGFTALRLTYTWLCRHTRLSGLTCVPLILTIYIEYRFDHFFFQNSCILTSNLQKLFPYLRLLKCGRDDNLHIQ